MLALNTVISYCWCACSLVPRLMHKSLGTRLVCMLLVMIRDNMYTFIWWLEWQDELMDALHALNAFNWKLFELDFVLLNRWYTILCYIFIVTLLNRQPKGQLPSSSYNYTILKTLITSVIPSGCTHEINFCEINSYNINFSWNQPLYKINFNEINSYKINSTLVINSVWAMHLVMHDFIELYRYWVILFALKESLTGID